MQDQTLVAISSPTDFRDLTKVAIWYFDEIYADDRGVREFFGGF